jgi:hypothetical protein
MGLFGEPGGARVPADPNDYLRTAWRKAFGLSTAMSFNDSVD